MRVQFEKWGGCNPRPDSLSRYACRPSMVSILFAVRIYHVRRFCRCLSKVTPEEEVPMPGRALMDSGFLTLSSVTDWTYDVSFQSGCFVKKYCRAHILAQQLPGSGVLRHAKTLFRYSKQVTQAGRRMVPARLNSQLRSCHRSRL